MSPTPRGKAPRYTGLALGVILSALTAFAQSTPYHLVEGWHDIPSNTKWGPVIGVDVDAQGNIWVFHRSNPPILEFDPSGKLLTSFGTDMFVQAHGLAIDSQGHIWVSDAQGKDGKGQQVL